MKQLAKLGLLMLSIVFLVANLKAQDLQPSQQPHLTGYWKFQDTNALTKGTLGKDLKLFGSHQWVSGPVKSDTAIRIGIGSYYKCDHGIPPNGGDSVNRYTLIFDFKIDNLDRWHTFFQTDTNNLNDGECFIRPNTQSNPGRIGTATTGYTPEPINVKQWYRLVISVNLGSWYRYYLNGQLVLEGNNQDVDDRFALNPYFLLFADNDQEDDTIDIASVAVFDTCLSASEINALGTVDPCILYPITLQLGNDTSLCGNNSLTRTLSKGVSYKWSTGDTDSTVTFNVNKVGLGTKMIWAEIKDKNNCVKRDTFNLSIYSNPSVNLGKDTSFCKGPSYKLVAGTASGNTFEWKHLPSGTIVSKVNNMSTDSSGLYVVRMTNANGCSAFDSVQITAHPIPSKPTINYNALQVCEGDTLFFSGTNGHAEYQWSDGQSTQSIKYTISGGLRLRVKSAFGCMSPASDSISFSVNTLPSAPDIIALPDTSFCMGDSVLAYVAQNANYSGIEWNDGYSKFSRQMKQSGTYTARITDFNACISEWSEPIHVLALTRPQNPIISSLNGLDFCDGDTAYLTCSHDADSILWSNGSNEASIKVTNGSTFWVEAMNYNGCKNINRGEIELQFHPVPEKPVVLINTWGDSMYGPATASKYEWKSNGSLVDSMRIIPIIYYRIIELRVKNEYCWSEWSDTMFFYHNIISPAYQPITIYPNPTSHNEIYIVNSIDFTSAKLSVFSKEGKLILQKELYDGNIDISGLSPGVYALVIEAEGKHYMTQFIKS